MGFDQRSYSGKLFRPKPEIFLSDDEQLLIVCTPWGPRNICKEAVETAKEFIMTAKKDPEATSPVPKLPGLSHLGNILRAATLLMNDHLLKTHNKDEYVAGVEAFLALRDDSELVWTQVGQPNLMLCRQNMPVLPMSTQFDLSMEFSEESSEMLPPLANHLLGVDSSPHITVNSLQIHKGDMLLLLSRAWVPPGFLSSTSHNWNLNDLGRVLSKDSANVPFWVGSWKLL